MSGTNDAAIIDGLWQFVLDRFAFQAKQIQKVEGLPLAQSYDVLARGHGYSNWRGLKRIVDALHHVDQWLDSGEYDAVPSEEERLAMEFAAALNGVGEDFGYDEDGRPDGRVRELALFKKTSLSDSELRDQCWDGLGELDSIREELLHQSLWIGREGLWSENAYIIANDFYNRLLVQGDGDEDLAEELSNSIFGVTSMDNYWRHKSDQRSLRKLDRQVKLCLTDKMSDLPEPLISAYLSADREECLTIADWRTRLRDAHPRTLDGRVDWGPIPILALSNAPPDCWTILGLNWPPTLERKDYPARWFCCWSVFAPTIEAAAKCATTTPCNPIIATVKEEDAIKRGIEHLIGFTEITFS